MGYYLDADFDLEFVSTEALIQAAHALQSTDVGLVSTPSAAWDVIAEGWEQCGENAEIQLKDADGLVFYGWSSGKWYGADWETFSEALKGRAVGTVDFNEGVDAIWRERLHADGTITQHPGTIIYADDRGE